MSQGGGGGISYAPPTANPTTAIFECLIGQSSICFKLIRRKVGILATGHWPVRMHRNASTNPRLAAMAFCNKRVKLLRH